MPTFVVKVDASSISVIVVAKNEDAACAAAEKAVAKKLGLDLDGMGDFAVEASEVAKSLTAKEENVG